MYIVIFNDSVHGMVTEFFDNFSSAIEFWNDYADTPSCINGTLYDAQRSEIIFQF